MNQSDYQKLVDASKYQVFLFHSPCGLPLSFASHPWFVCNEKSDITRWEIRINPNTDSQWGHLHINNLPPFSGIEMLPYNSNLFWSAKLIGKIEGDYAKKMIKLIKDSREKYPYYNKYSLIGTNSNTYAQWILNHFPELDFSLPWNSFGKNILLRK